MGNSSSSFKPRHGKKVHRMTSSRRRAFAWERKVLEKQLLGVSPYITHAIIVGLEDRKVRAIAPHGFTPEKQGVNDVLDALNNDVTGLQERGIVLGGDLPAMIPGKMDKDRTTIYCSDGRDRGCIVWKTVNCALIVIYKENPEAAARLASDVASYLKQYGR